MAAACLVAAVLGGPGPARPRSGAGAGGRAAGRGLAAGADRSTIATPDDQGSFSVPCDYSHSAPDDPIVHARHRGASHRHDFFGATTIDAASTANTLLAGGTTCRSVADRSAYWAPALLAGGRPVTPTHVVAYYRTPVGADARQVQPLPNGLEMIAGDAAATSPQDPAAVRWACGRDDAWPVPRRCPGRGAELRLVLVFPACWDGVHLRSADHVSHLARFPGGIGGADDGQDGIGGGSGGDEGGGIRDGGGEARCPASHPILLPETTVEVRYPTDLPLGDLTLASGPATGGHGDLLVAWEGDAQAHEVDTCLRRNLRCDVTSEPARLDPGV